MDGIIEENIKSFAKGFVDNQSRIAELEYENKKLKENNDKLKELVKIPCTSYTRDLEKKNKELKKELERYKKQYEHTMGED